MTVDSHQHFWRYEPVAYHWLSEPMRALRRDFLPADLETETVAAGVDGTIAVQALQTLGETRFLLGLARENPFILGVVGWVPLTDPSVAAALEELALDPVLKGCRHVLQDEPDDNFMLRPDFNEGVSAVTAAGLVYDILIYERHLPQTLQFVDRHPGQLFVLDHIGKPGIRDRSFAGWSAAIRDLAHRPNVYCKVSGMATEADWEGWTEEDLLPYLDTVLDAFGPRRLMFGSDWPMSLVAVEYGRWCDLVRRYVSRLSEGERELVLGGTAAQAYGLVPCGSLPWK